MYFTESASCRSIQAFSPTELFFDHTVLCKFKFCTNFTSTQIKSVPCHLSFTVFFSIINTVEISQTWGTILNRTWAVQVPVHVCADMGFGEVSALALPYAALPG